MYVVVDTNVILVANGIHPDASPECVIECIQRLEQLMKAGKVVIDDAFRIINEYQNKTTPRKSKRPGDVFVLWLLRNRANRDRVECVSLQERECDVFEDFPVADLQAVVDAPDRKFIATAGAHPKQPAVWQATDCKWLDWWSTLKKNNVTVEFLCPVDICRFYRRRFADRNVPPLP
jgi:hypothetical protein